MRSLRRIVSQVTVSTIAAAAAAGLSIAATGPALASAGPSFIGQFHTISTIASTVPANGDVNPYGIAVLSQSVGRLHAGDILVSNFNDSANEQGTGRTIVEISPGGQRSVFASISGALPGACPGGVGLTTALAVLPGGWVIVGSTPSANGAAATARAGCLIVLGPQGHVRETIAGHGINGPWDATAVSSGSRSDLFVTNVLNGTVAAAGGVVHRGTVLRLTLSTAGRTPPQLTNVVTVASGLAEQTNAAAFILGPTGVGLSPDGTLYVADTDTSQVTAIPDAAFRHRSAGPGLLLSAGGALSGPLGLTVAPGGDVLTVNGDNGNIVEITPSGHQVATAQLDSSGSPAGAGALFGLAVAPGGHGVYYVDDAANTLRLLH